MTKKASLALSFFLLVSGYSFAQSPDSLKVKNSFFTGISFHQNENKLDFNEALKLVDQNEIAEEFIRKSKNQSIAAIIVGGVGGFLIGRPVGTAIGGGDPEWTLLYVGVAISAFSFPIYNSAVKNARKGASEYNLSLAGTTRKVNTQLTITFNSTGTGLKLSF